MTENCWFGRNSSTQANINRIPNEIRNNFRYNAFFWNNRVENTLWPINNYITYSRELIQIFMTGFAGQILKTPLPPILSLYIKTKPENYTYLYNLTFDVEKHTLSYNGSVEV